MANLVIKPTTNNSLKIQDQGGTERISLNTSGELSLPTVTSATIGSGVTFPAGTTINTTYGTYSTQTQLASPTNTYNDVISVTVTRKQSSSTMMVRGVLPVYWYTGQSNLYVAVRLYRSTSTAAQLGYFHLLRTNNTNTGHAETVTIDGFDTSPAASTVYKLQILSSTHDSYPYFCYNSSTASLVIQEIAG